MINDDIHGMIVQGTVDVFAKALQNFAKKGINDQPVAVTDVQIWIGTKSDEICMPYQWLVIKGEPVMRERNIPGTDQTEMSAEIIFEEILDVLNDVAHDGDKFNVFANSMFIRLANQYKTDPRNIELQIMADPGAAENVVPVAFLYDRSLPEGINEDQTDKQLIGQAPWLDVVFNRNDTAEILKQIQENS